MKKFVLIGMMMTVVLFACKKENQSSTSSPQSVTVSSLPVKVTDYINNNYPDAAISTAYKMSNSQVSYIVELNTTELLAFNNSNDYIGDGANFSGPGGPGGDGHGHGHGHGPHGGCGDDHGHHGIEIPVDSLSSAITTYVTTNYAAYTIMHAEIDTICPTGAITEVMLRQQGQPPVKLVFDMTGTFLMSGARADYASAPQLVKDYITTNYSTYTAMHKAEKFTLANATVEYAVYLFKPQSFKRVIIQDNGTFICEQ